MNHWTSIITVLAATYYICFTGVLSEAPQPAYNALSNKTTDEFNGTLLEKEEAEVTSLPQNITRESATTDVIVVLPNGTVEYVVSDDSYSQSNGSLDIRENFSAISSFNESKVESKKDESDSSRADYEYAFLEDGIDKGTITTVSEFSQNITNTSSNIDTNTVPLFVSTVSWLEAFMDEDRSTYWIVFNTLFMVIWIGIGIFSLYRLLALVFCSPLLTRTMYLIIHLMIFTAATFSIVQLLHLSFGNQKGLPLFLTLLLTHTPVPCLSTCILLIGYCIFLASRVPVYGTYLPSLTKFSLVLGGAIFCSFFSDIVVGVSHNSAVLILFRFLINCFCMALFLGYICSYTKIFQVALLLKREFSGDVKSLVIPVSVVNKELSEDVKKQLSNILLTWSRLTLASCVAGCVMCISSFCLSLFYTVSQVPLWLFWFLHSFLFLSELVVVITMTLGATLTLTNTNRDNVLLRYFIVSFPSQNAACGSFIKHGNFIYQRVSFAGAHPSTQNNSATEETALKNNETLAEIQQLPPRNQRVNLRRAVTFNYGPQESSYYQSRQLYPILSDCCIVCPHNCDRGNINEYSSTHCCPHRGRSSRCSRDCKCSHADEVELPYAHYGKYPRKNYYGRGKFSSMRNLPNGSPPPQTHTEAELLPVKLNSIPIASVHLPKSSDTPPLNTCDNQSQSDCVKDIILENHPKFNPIVRKSSIRTTLTKPENSPTHSISPSPSSPATTHEFRCIQNASPPAVSPPSPDCPPEYGVKSSPSPIKKPPSPFYNRPTPPSRRPLITKPLLHMNRSPPAMGTSSPVLMGENFKHNSFSLLNSPLSKFQKDKSHANSSGEQRSIEMSSYEKPNECLDEPVEIKEVKEALAADADNSHPIQPLSPPNSNSFSKEINAVDFECSTLPKRQSLKRNHSSAGDFVSSNSEHAPANHLNGVINDDKLRYPWYGTWGGRRRPRKRSNVSTGDNSDPSSSTGLKRLSGSKSSLSNLYEKLKPRRTKSMLHPSENIVLNEPITRTADTDIKNGDVDEKEELEDAFPIPKETENSIDLASEIFKSSRLLADFYSLKEAAEEEDEDAQNTPQETELTNCEFESPPSVKSEVKNETT